MRISRLAIWSALALGRAGAATATTTHRTGDAAGSCSTTPSGMGMLQDFARPCDPGANAFLLTASGEVLAIVGYRVPAGQS